MYSRSDFQNLLIIFLGIIIILTLLVIILLIILLIIKNLKKENKIEIIDNSNNPDVDNSIEDSTVSADDNNSIEDSTVLVDDNNSIEDSTVSIDDEATISIFNNINQKIKDGSAINKFIMDDCRNSSISYSLSYNESFIIGRKEKSDLIVNGDKSISVMHCEIVKKGSSVYIHDLNSSNGTLLNNRMISNDLFPIKEGDKLYIGRTSLLIRRTN